MARQGFVDRFNQALMGFGTGMMEVREQKAKEEAEEKLRPFKTAMMQSQQQKADLEIQNAQKQAADQKLKDNLLKKWLRISKQPTRMEPTVSETGTGLDVTPLMSPEEKESQLKAIRGEYETLGGTLRTPLERTRSDTLEQEANFKKDVEGGMDLLEAYKKHFPKDAAKLELQTDVFKQKEIWKEGQKPTLAEKVEEKKTLTAAGEEAKQPYKELDSERRLREAKAKKEMAFKEHNKQLESVINGMLSLESKVPATETGLKARGMGVVTKVKAKAGYEAAASQLENMGESFLPTFAKSIGKDVGNLAQQEQERWKHMLFKLSDTKEERKFKVAFWNGVRTVATDVSSLENAYNTVYNDLMKSKANKDPWE